MSARAFEPARALEMDTFKPWQVLACTWKLFVGNHTRLQAAVAWYGTVMHRTHAKSSLYSFLRNSALNRCPVLCETFCSAQWERTVHMLLL